jgi:hypothetical protein
MALFEYGWAQSRFSDGRWSQSLIFKTNMGSHAYGTPTPDSDFDLYVVIPDDGIRPIEAMQIIGGALYKEQKKSIDILVSRTSDFQQRKLLPTIEKTVARDGVRLYG